MSLGDRSVTVTEYDGVRFAVTVSDGDPVLPALVEDERWTPLAGDSVGLEAPPSVDVALEDDLLDAASRVVNGCRLGTPSESDRSADSGENPQQRPTSAPAPVP
ncbi:hypothetical protein C491_14102 [Natronococcus amylolyticus DSM 10524]|uniref:Uncharacterized protein n=1 Tax=Natronococcus amylolyticus DSM 10524 TaxID=1227497 RepID=L9X686_9EURY|nr:hypothetical protein [Natronococcus amylolyticus]ELY56088.1 hypothetical protein C491_14102 [Natronococcus amylolyticus DSM 10524]